MGVSFNGTTLTFNDGTTQISAAQPISYSGLRGQLFTASGTFSVPIGVTAVKVTLIGGGGGGGPGIAGSSYGLGGASAGVATGYVTGLNSGANVTVTVGAGGTAGPAGGTGGNGGTSTFSTMSATGGGGSSRLTGGSAGTGSGGIFNVSGKSQAAGSDGMGGVNSPLLFLNFGYGGVTPSSGSTPAATGTGYGAGGSGGNGTLTGYDPPGAAGTPGFVWIEW